MHQEHGTLNGAATLYLMIGEIRSDVKHLESGLHDLKEEVGTLSHRRPRAIPWRDMGGFLFAAAVLILAMAGKWALIGELAHGFGR